jgi:tryptophan 2,3-dioxygenase
MLGNKNAGMLKVFEANPPARAMLAEILRQTSIYDEFLALLSRRGFAVPAELLARDLTKAHVFNQAVVEAVRVVYEKPDDHWDLYEACEELVDLEDNFQLWRFRHVATVKRIIGMKSGTGGSSGVGFLQRALDLTFFPELYAVRTEIGN